MLPSDGHWITLAGNAATQENSRPQREGAAHFSGPECPGTLTQIRWPNRGVTSFRTVLMEGAGQRIAGDRAGVEAPVSKAPASVASTVNRG